MNHSLQENSSRSKARTESPAAARAVPLLALAVAFSVPTSARADYASEVLSEDPLAYYRFDDSVTTDDQPTAETNLGSLGAAGDAALSGTLVREVPGALAGSTDVAARMVGNGFSVPYNPALNHQGSFSVEVWLNPTLDDIPALTCPIASWRENTDELGREGWLIYQGAAATGFNFRTYNKNGANTAVSISSGPGVTIGAWHHVVATWDNDEAVGRIYVNGELKATSPVIQAGGTNGRAFDANSSSNYTLGSRSDNAFGWSGDVDEPAYYADTVLTPAQVLARYNNGISPTPSPDYPSLILADSPVGYWRMNNTWVPRTPPVANNSGTLATGADGTYHDGSKNSPTGPSPSSGFDGFGAGNSSLSLETANGYVSSGLSLLNERTSFTVMGWVKRGAIQSTRGGYFGQNDLLEFGDAGEGTQVEAWNSSVGQLITDPPYPFADDEWGFIAYTADGVRAQLFVNGELVKSADFAVANYGSTAFNFNIGGGGVFNAAGDFFRGEIDEVAMLDRALSPGRIKQLYDSALGDVPPGLADTFPAVSPGGDVPEGQSYTLSIDPTGTPPFTYQWKVNGVDIPGANSRTYTVDPAVAQVPPFDPFIYTVLVSNGFGEPVLSDEIDVYVAPALRWSGSDPTNPDFWDFNTTPNWTTYSAGTPSNYTDDFSVIFDDGADTTAVELVDDVRPLGMIIANETKDYSFSGDWIISIPGGTVVKSGAGTAEFGNFAIDTDTIQVNEGIFRVGNGTVGELSPETKVSVDGGELEINQGTGGIFESQTTVANGRIAFVGTGDLSVSSTTNGISGPGDEWFDRAGTVVVAMANTVGGSVTINSGTVAFDGNQNANRLAASKVVTVNPGATMEIRGVNALPTGVNSVSTVLTDATLNIISGASFDTGPGGQSHAHLFDLDLDASSVVLGFSGDGSAYNGESFQLNGDISVSGSGPSSVTAAIGTDNGNSGVALSNIAHTFSVPDVSVGADLIIGAELENSDAGAAASSLLKTGTGTLSLAGGITHSFSGTFQVSEGTLEASGSIAGPLLVDGPATLAPGPGAATFGAGATTLGGTFACEIDGAAADRIEVTGDLTFAPGATIAVNVLAGGATAPFYEIMSCSGSLSGALPTVTGAPAGYTLSQVSTSILLVESEGDFSPVFTLVPGSVESPLAGDDFTATDGGFTVSAPVSPETDWTYSPGEWSSNGQATGFGADNTSFLISPPFTLTKSGVVSLSFDHRFSFEINFDGGAVAVSLNGGPFTQVAATSFSENGYTGTLGDVGHSLAFSDAFVGNSPGHPAFITSVCKLTAGNVGDTVQVRFISASDNNTVGNQTPPGWQIDQFEILEGGAGGAILEWPIGTMEYSDTLQDPWFPIPGGSPAFIDTTLAPKRFFRIRP